MEKSVEAKQSNRRRSQRCKARKTVKVQCRKGSHGLGPNLALNLLDISDTGIRLVTTQSVDVMAEVEIIFDGYGMKANIKRIGDIRWQVKLENGQFCIGVEFHRRLDYRDWQNLVSPS